MACDKPVTGSEQFLKQNGSPVSKKAPSISMANWNKVLPLPTVTGSLWSPSPRRNLSRRLESVLEEEGTGNPPDQMRPAYMYSKRTQGVLNLLSLEAYQSEELKVRIGDLCWSQQRLAPTLKFRRMSWYVIIAPSTGSLLILRNLLSLKDSASSFMGSLVSANQNELGMKQAPMLILSARGPNFGVVTEVNQMLSSMSFEEVSTLATCSDGWIDILSEWRLKDPLECSWHASSGSPQTYTQENGILDWTLRPSTPYYAE